MAAEETSTPVETSRRSFLSDTNEVQRVKMNSSSSIIITSVQKQSEINYYFNDPTIAHCTIENGGEILKTRVAWFTISPRY